MSEMGSVSLLLRGLYEGNETQIRDNMEKLYTRFWPFLLKCAREKLDPSRCRAFDEKDIALESFNSFYQGFISGKFPDLENRYCLFGLFGTITNRKAKNKIEFENRRKRGGGQIHGESWLLNNEDSRQPFSPKEMIESPDPSPDKQAIVSDYFISLINRLSPDLQEITWLLVTGHKPREIATILGCSTRTVENKRKRIYDVWKRLADE